MRKNRVDVTCHTCGKVFEIQFYAREKTRFCGRSCYEAYRKNKFFGDRKLDSNQIASEYLSGKSCVEIAAIHDASVASICYHLKKAGVKIRPYTGESLTRPEVRKKINEANSKRKGILNPNFKDIPIHEISEQYINGDSLEVIAERYKVTANTIQKRLIASGIKLRRQGFSRKRRCPDGHFVDSQWEYSVDKWLESHGIEHEIHPIVPWWKGGKSPSRSDFKVGDTYIEVWGIINNDSYNQKRLSKIRKFQELNIRLVEIFPHHILSKDFSPLEVLLR